MAKAKQSAATSVISIEDVSPDAANVRKRTDRNREAIRASLKQLKAGRSIVIDKDNVVRAGNGTVEAARELGFKEIIVVEPKDGQIVAVKRADWTATEATQYAIADNRSAELAEWDEQALAAQLDTLRGDLPTTGFTVEELDKMLAKMGDDLMPAESETMPTKFEVIIECSNENRQQELFDEFTGRGLECRLLTL